MRKFFTFSAALIVAAAVLILPNSVQADNISFNYQGRVKVHGQPVNGTGLLKFAILNTSATAVLWSNDGTVGTGNGELPVPSSAIGLPITDGVFSVQIGDETVSGMAPLDSAVMVSDTPLRLRVWFSDGELGFQELSPDHKLVDLTLNKIQTGTEDYTIYVNDATGNDANNGLSPETAKKTITGAVDIVPDKVRCNITVSIAPGVYRETVNPHGISVAFGKKLIFLGDNNWTPSSVGSPSVVIDGSNTGNSADAIREFGIYARQCNGVEITGITFKNCTNCGIRLENGTYIVNRCHSLNNPSIALVIPPAPATGGYGFAAGPQGYVTFNECKATGNERIGFTIESSSRAFLTTCTATNNEIGVFCTSDSVAQFYNYNNFSNNDVGVQANSIAEVSVWPSTNVNTRTHIENNTRGVVVNWKGIFTPGDAVIVGNGTKYDRYYGTIIGVDPQ